ncbi:MAG: BamA/TamA family outer membrane protein, partial [Bacteroidota bacterium]
DFNAIQIKPAGTSKNRWAADRVITRFHFDPVFKLSVLAEARLRDVQGNHQLTIGFRPFIDLRSSDTYIRYLNKKKRLDWFAGVERRSRFLNRFDFAARYNATEVNGGVIYPLNRFLSVGAGGHLVYINRRNMDVFIPRPIDGQDMIASANVNLTYDKTRKNRGYVLSGTRARLDVQNAYSIADGNYNFTTARLDLRHYIPIKKVVLATRLASGWSTGSREQQFFMGGTQDWLFSRFENTQDFPIEGEISALNYMDYVTPIHGFRFNARNGSKYVTANAELRIPVSRAFKSYLNSNPLYNFEVIPFFEVGTTWSQGNPLSQRNPIDTQTIPSYPLSITVQTLKSPFIMGFGAGARTMLFGYSVRADLGWAVEDYTILTPRFHLSLGKNF